jgi:hypothetical protein
MHTAKMQDAKVRAYVLLSKFVYYEAIPLITRKALMQSIKGRPSKKCSK